MNKVDQPRLEAEYDIVIVGSGGGSFCAALAALSLGKRPVILEKQAVVGGSTAFSGGVWWIPDNHLMKEAGIPDSIERGRTYLANCVDHKGPAVTPERTDAFLKAAPKMHRFLVDQGIKVRRTVDVWPDYYDDRPGGSPEGRCVIAQPFNLYDLGPYASRLATHPMMVRFPMSVDQFAIMFTMKRTWAGKLKAAKLGWFMVRDKLLGRKTLCNGGAIQGQMLKVAIERQVPLFWETPVSDLIVENGRVVGVRATHEGRPVEIRARDGVLVNSGGFSRNQEMRQKYGRKPISAGWTNANPGDTGEVLQAMMNLGAATDALDTAIWNMTSFGPGETWPEGAKLDETTYPFMHHMDLSLPGSMMVDQDGKRIMNECQSYQEVGERLYEHHQATGRGLPAWVIMDGLNRQRYPWGTQPPGHTPKQWLESGYMKKADTLEELARLCGIDPADLVAEAARYSQFARTGIDEDFNRGGRAFDRAHGDPTVKPNPNLAPIENGSFYAVALYHGDVGTSGGVVTDEYARVKRDDGSIIPGLYAAGNVAASPFGRTYPGAGASISNAFTFGFIAAHHAAGSNQLETILA